MRYNFFQKNLPLPVTKASLAFTNSCKQFFERWESANVRFVPYEAKIQSV